MKSFREPSASRTVYILGLFLAVPLLALVFLYHSGRFHFDLTEAVAPCVFHRLSGLYCPGCGGTRAVHALMEGDLAASVLYHPFVPYCAVLYVLFMVSHTLEWVVTHATRKKPSHETSFVKGLPFKMDYAYIGILLILLQWMVKNLLAIFNIHIS